MRQNIKWKIGKEIFDAKRAGRKVISILINIYDFQDIYQEKNFVPISKYPKWKTKETGEKGMLAGIPIIISNSIGHGLIIARSKKLKDEFNPTSRNFG